MTKEKHTPGPWYVDTRQMPTGAQIHIKNDTGNNAHGVICLVKASNGRKLANANLIAAAPRLLRALQKAEYHAQVGTIPNDDDLYEISTAITKAKGE